MAKKKQKNTFEDNLSRLEEIGKELDEGDLGLEKSIALFEEGIQLSKSCITALQKAELKITELKNDLSEITSGEDEEEIE
jgi:exodeoxyribonuclease VII small subunit